MNNSSSLTHLYDVAIVGMAGRFPGAPNIAAFWQNLREGVESISFFSDEELVGLGIDPAMLKRPDYVKAGGVLDGAEMFDASFFGFTPKEAEITDPQHRVFLESAWEALEDAGYNPETYAGRIGLYAGAGINTYITRFYSNPIPISMANFQAMVGNDKDFLATRVSYKLNLRGPSVAVQTACSTSLVAVHLAYQSLLNHECDMALAGGVSIAPPQNAGYIYQESGILSQDGHCRAFDAQAQGVIGGNGVCLVVLKRLADALADGDYVYAIIKGSAINNDGALKVGYTAPSVDGQAAVIAEALAAAKVEPETIGYIEAHGTGTALGDPIEIAALTQVFRSHTPKKNFCAIGSVKTNIGHLSAAAGVAGLIKAVLTLQHKLIPPSLHFQQPNPQIDFANSPFYVNTKLTEWKSSGTPRRAGVSSFGFGGTNAHVVLEEASVPERAPEAKPWQLLALSARSDSALETATANLARHLKQHPDSNLADVAYTLQVGRKAFGHRRITVCRDANDALTMLEAPDPSRVFANAQDAYKQPVAFMFPGQGAQYVNMGLGLYRSEPTFRAQVDLCAELFTPHLGLDLRDILYPVHDSLEPAGEPLEQTRLTQPALFTIEYALAKLWMEWGIQPQAIVGHSIGEYVAACLAGVFSLEDAAMLVATRGRLIQALPRGAMLAVPLSEEALRPLLDKPLSLAGINSPAHCVASGPTEAIDELEKRLVGRGIKSRRLHTSHAFHSQMLDSILGPFADAVKKVQLGRPQLRYLSNVSGTWITPGEATDAGYWIKHLRQTVLFSQNMQELLKEPELVLLEVGPGRTLATFARQQPLLSQRGVILTSLPHRDDHQSDRQFILNTLGRLWLAGAPVNWGGLYTHERRSRLPLPTYPFERQRYWIEPRKQSSVDINAEPIHAKKSDLKDWCYLPIWKQARPLIGGVLENGTSNQAGWLIFADERGLGKRMAERLEQAGQTVILVRRGPEFAKVDTRTFVIDPREREHYQALIADLHASQALPQIIVHLWNITPDEVPLSGIARFEAWQSYGFYSLLFLVQALSNQNSTQPLALQVVSNNMQEVTGKEWLSPEKAALLGICRVIPQEYGNLTCRSIDIDMPEPGSWRETKLIEQLVAEPAAPSTETVIAYRGGRRWVQTFEPAPLDESVKATLFSRANGVYLITGGLGNIGFVFAEYLAKAVQAKLVLTARSQLPSREDWAQWLAAHAAENDTSRKIRRVCALEESGAKVLILSADVADREQMQKVIEKTYAHFGGLNGIIHAAGSVGDKSFSLLQELGPDECEHHFQPKVRGLFVLEEVLRGKPIDFCLLMSSLSTVLGGVGLGAYASANAFMDAFADQQNQAGPLPWISVDWDGWQLTPAPNASPGLAALQEFAITPKEGVEVLRRILTLDTSRRIVVSTGDLQARLDQAAKPRTAFTVEHATRTGAGALHPRPCLQNPYVGPRDEIEEALADIWQKQLGVEQIGIHDNFFELGGDSLLAIQLIAQIGKTFQVELSVQSLIETPTVAGHARVVAAAQKARQDKKAAQLLTDVEQLSEDEVKKLLAAKRTRAIALGSVRNE